MRSGYIVLALIVISITLTSVITMTLVTDFGIENEENAFVRFLFGKLGVWAFPLVDIIGVSYVYLVLVMLRKIDIRVASSWLLAVMLLSISDLAHDTHVLVTHNSPFSLFTFFFLVPVFVVFSLCLFGSNKISPLKF